MARREANKPDSLVQPVLTAMMAALIFVCSFVLKIPMANGYANLGDLAVFMAAALLGNPWAAIAAALGSGLADFMAGYTVYIPATLIIKGAMALLTASLAKKGKLVPFMLGTFLSGAVMCGGYFVWELYIYREGDTLGLGPALSGLIPMNLVQAAVCVVFSWLMFRPVLSLRIRLLPSSTT